MLKLGSVRICVESHLKLNVSDPITRQPVPSGMHFSSAVNDRVSENEEGAQAANCRLIDAVGSAHTSSVGLKTQTPL